MILAGDETQAQFATVGVRPHPSGPRGSLASPGGRSAFRSPTLSGSVSHPGRTAPARGTRPQAPAAYPGEVQHRSREPGAFAVKGIPSEPMAGSGEISCSILQP